MSEVVSIQQADQFVAGRSQYECGFYSIAELTSMAKVGSPPTKTAQQVSDDAQGYYTQYNGTNTDYGMTDSQEYALLHQVGLHYQGLATFDDVRQFVVAGYPCIIACPESSIVDLEFNAYPYPWPAQGSHIFVVTGIASDGNFLCRDSANIVPPNTLRPGPRTYDASKLVFESATAVVPPWLPRPTYPLGVTPMVPQGWSDANGILTAPNGFVVVKGFRDYILNNSWDATNYPLENEHAVDSQELSNPALGPGTQQAFRLTVMEWTQAKGVYLMWVGAELLATRAALAQLELQIKQVTQAVDPAAVHQLLVAVVNATDNLANVNSVARSLLPK